MNVYKTFFGLFSLILLILLNQKLFTLLNGSEGVYTDGMSTTNGTPLVQIQIS